MPRYKQRRFLHVYLRSRLGVKKSQIEKIMDKAFDWIRYDENCWILYTITPVRYWQARLRHFAEGGGNLFICRLDVSERNGWMSKDFWSWIRREEE